MLRARTYALVEHVQIGKRTRSEARCEFTRNFLSVGVAKFRPVGTEYLIRDSAGNISRKEHLQGALARLTSRTHNTSRMKNKGGRMKIGFQSLIPHSSSLILFKSRL